MEKLRQFCFSMAQFFLETQLVEMFQKWLIDIYLKNKI